MPVIENEITRFRGDTYPLIVTIKENGIAVDISTAVTKMTIAFIDEDKVSAPVTIIGTNVDGSLGRVSFAFIPEVVNVVGKFFYDIQVDSGGYKTTYVKDIIIFLRDVTSE